VPCAPRHLLVTYRPAEPSCPQRQARLGSWKKRKDRRYDVDVHCFSPCAEPLWGQHVRPSSQNAKRRSPGSEGVHKRAYRAYRDAQARQAACGGNCRLWDIAKARKAGSTRQRWMHRPLVNFGSSSPLSAPTPQSQTGRWAKDSDGEFAGRHCAGTSSLPKHGNCEPSATAKEDKGQIKPNP
jgi:hypothetical protein